MAETITVDGVDRSGVIHREDCEWAESAYQGEVGAGRVVIHDDAGTITAAGYKNVTVDQSSASPVRMLTAFVGRKAIKRGSFLADPGTSREYSFATKDANDLLQRLKIRAAAGNRKVAETISATLTWLLASELSRVSVADYGRVEYPTVMIDAVDRRGQFPGDVLAALAKACRRNYYVCWNTAHAGFELVFRDDNASTADTSTITISNAGDSDDTTIFAPAMDDELSQDPEHVYSGVQVNYAKGNRYRTRAATAAAFVSRDGETEDAATKIAATADRDGDTFLWESHTEEQLLPVKLHMKAATVNLILPGQRVPVHMTHMTPEGWNPLRYARVMRRKVTQPAGTDFDYEVALDLSPQEPACSTQPALVQSKYAQSARIAGPAFSQQLTFPATVPGDLVIMATVSQQADPMVGAVSPDWIWPLQNLNIKADNSTFWANIFYKRSIGDAEFTGQYSYVSDTLVTMAMAEYSGLANPALYAAAVSERTGTGIGYSVVPATSYPAGACLVHETCFMQTGPENPDALTANGTGFSLVYAVSSPAQPISPAIGMGHQRRLTSDLAGTTIHYATAGGWRFLFTNNAASLSVGLVFVGDNC